jgi:hypothetical protein
MNEPTRNSWLDLYLLGKLSLQGHWQSWTPDWSSKQKNIPFGFICWTLNIFSKTLSSWHQTETEYGINSSSELFFIEPTAYWLRFLWDVWSFNNFLDLILMNYSTLRKIEKGTWNQNLLPWSPSKKLNKIFPEHPDGSYA